MEKKASELLLELEQKIDLILGYLKTSDLNYKLIIARLDKLASSINQPIATTPVKPSMVPTVPQLTPRIAVPEFQEVDENNLPIINEELQPQSGRRDQRTPGQNKKKTQVQQKISYPDGKVVILANVEISDGAGQVVKQTRTNHAGKWSAALEPGKYLVKIYKPPTSNKPVVEQKFVVDIPASDTPLEL